MIVLGLFTLTEAYLVGAITATYQVQTVMLAFIITLVVVVALTAYATQVRPLPHTDPPAWPVARGPWPDRPTRTLLVLPSSSLDAASPSASHNIPCLS